MAHDRSQGSHDPTRRQFFRTFGRQAISNAGAAMGAAEALRRSSADAARGLLALGIDDPRTTAAALTETPAIADAAERFSSPYRFTGDELVILDQRELPARHVTVTCRAPSEIASAIRARAINGGPVLAEVVAYALAIAAADAVTRSTAGGEHLFRAATNTLAGARDGAQAIGWAIESMAARRDALLDDGADPTQVATALREEADRLASSAADAHAAIARVGAAHLAGQARAGQARAGQARADEDGVIHLLMHGNAGSLSCGLVGMGTALLAALAAAGRDAHVWVTEAGPSGEGARLAAIQLAQNDVAHTVIPDTAVAWLLANRRIDAALLRGDWVAANGDTGALIGSLNVARLAAAAGVPVHVLAPPSAIDRATAGGQYMAAELAVADLPPSTAGRLEPERDVVPAELITTFLIEAGAVTAAGLTA